MNKQSVEGTTQSTSFRNTQHSRAQAAQILSKVLQNKKSLTESMEMVSDKERDPFAQVLCYGVLRFYFKLDFFLTELTAYALKDIEIKSLLLIGLYQLFFLQKPAYAVVSETVNAAKQLKKNWAAKLINGILRNAIRQYESLEKKASQDISVVFNHPKWLIEAMKNSYPDQWQTILEQNNQQAPMTLRLNLLKQSRDDYLEILNQQGIEAQKTQYSSHGVVLEKPLPVDQVMGFKEGLISVQDEAAQLSVPLLQLSAGQIILDACAAPGGKTTHILEMIPNLSQLIVVDVDAERLKRVEENLQRLRLVPAAQMGIHARAGIEIHESKIKLLCSDIKALSSRFQENYFDRILLDAPCSATGVIRRHPDIKLLRIKKDIVKLAKEQLNFLKSVWPLLKKEGLLLYTTCSVLEEENAQVIDLFLQETSNATEIPIDANWGNSKPRGRQILPGESNMDGFYFCCLKKA